MQSGGSINKRFSKLENDKQWDLDLEAKRYQFRQAPKTKIQEQATEIKPPFF